MKKYLSAFLILVMALLVGANLVQAEDNVSVSAGVNVDTHVDTAAGQKMNGLKAQIKGERDAAKAKVEAARINVREAVLLRFDAATSRISNLVDRVNAKITDLSTKGIDVTSAQSFMVTANTNLADAQAKVATANTLLSGSITVLTTDQRTQLRALAKDTETSLQVARTAIRSAIADLKVNVSAKLKVSSSQ